MLHDMKYTKRWGIIHTGITSSGVGIGQVVLLTTNHIYNVLRDTKHTKICFFASGCFHDADWFLLERGEFQVRCFLLFDVGMGQVIFNHENAKHTKRERKILLL